MHYTRLADIGLLSGLVAGFVAAIGARAAMRVLVVVDADTASEVGQPVGFTGETLFVLLAIALAGMPLGLLFASVRTWLPGAWAPQGLAFGTLLLLFIGLPTLLIESEYSVGPGLLTRVLFGGLFIVYGITLPGVGDRLASYWPVTGRHRISAVVGLVVLVIPGLLGLPLGLLVLGWHD